MNKLIGLLHVFAAARPDSGERTQAQNAILEYVGELAAQKPLEEPFRSILGDNAEKLYIRDEQPAAQSLGVAGRRELDNALFKQPAAWTGCGECDPMFECYDSDAACVRLPAEQPAPVVLTEEQAAFEAWCPYRGSPDPRVVWAAAWKAAVPPGCVVVPVEPTPEMKRAATLIAPTWDDHISAAKYRAMIAARPEERP